MKTMSNTAFRVMVVDDDPNILRALAARLKFEGYEVEVAQNAMSALGLVGEFEPNFALLDINMPGIDGLELAVAMDRVSGKSVEKVFLTASKDPSIRERADALGFFCVLEKPFESRELVDYLADAKQRAGIEDRKPVQ